MNMKILEKASLVSSHKAPFSGASKFLSVAHEKKKPKDRALRWLESQDTYTKHRPVRHRFPRRFYNVRNIYDFSEADLVDLRAIMDYNDGYVYLLVVIYVLSKFAWV